MSTLSADELRVLVEIETAPCVSIYMPSHRQFPEAAQDPIRFKNSVRQAEEELTSAGLKPAEARAFLDPARGILDDADFWRHQSDGLAVFIASDVLRYHRLPWRFPEVVVAARRFHLKPLLEPLAADGRFFILALSQKRVRLLEGSLEAAADVSPDDLPQGVGEILEQYELERQVQFRPGISGGAGGQGSLMHGHGKAVEDLKGRVREYFREIDHVLKRHLAGERAPLVLAAVEYLFPIYREVNAYPHLADHGVAGNPDLLSPDDLCRKASPIVTPLLQRARVEAAEKYHSLKGGGRTSNDLEQVAPAAFHGRVESLFVAVGVQRWGRFDPDSGRVQMRQKAGLDGEDMLDFLAVHTFLNGGAVFAVRPGEAPDGGPLAAVFRY